LAAAMPPCETEPGPQPAPQAASSCPDCNAQLAVLRIIPGRSAEYWTMRCTKCGGIHLNIVRAASPAWQLTSAENGTCAASRVCRYSFDRRRPRPTLPAWRNPGRTGLKSNQRPCAGAIQIVMSSRPRN
jgi:hypothetical protein